MSTDWDGTTAGPARARTRRRRLLGEMPAKRLLFSRAAVAMVGVSTTLGVALVVSGFAGPAAVHLPDLAGPSYAQDVTGFKPVTRHLLNEIAAAPGRGRATPVHAVPVAVVRSEPKTVAGPPSPVPEPSPAVVPPAPPPPPPPSLSIEMTSNTDRAHPNDTIVYTIRVANAGAGSAHHVVVESHIPDGTALSGWTCDGKTFDAGGTDHFTCGDMAGTPAHPVLYGLATLAPGQTFTASFWVKVSHGVTHNTDLVDHAHVYATGVDLIDSTDVPVIIK